MKHTYETALWFPEMSFPLQLADSQRDSHEPDSLLSVQVPRDGLRISRLVILDLKTKKLVNGSDCLGIAAGNSDTCTTICFFESAGHVLVQPL
jgi:hypothetical protein